MKVATIQPDSKAESRNGSFYRCTGVECGLRFPVGLRDSFDGRCPLCGRPATLVAHVEETQDDFRQEQTIAPKSVSRLSLLLDNWRSTFNVGAAFRTADGAGANHIFLCGISATPESQKRVAKTALGAEESVAWSYHLDAVRLAAQLQQEGQRLLVLERSSHSQSLFDITPDCLASQVVLVAGNEVSGVDPELTAMADQVLHLPMVGRKRSLNVAVALSIATYWITAQSIKTP